MIKTAIFSGSFNPVHVGHLVLANYLCEFTDVDEVWLMVSPQNPMKEPNHAVDARLRFQLLQQALLNDNKLKASDFELYLPTPTYTIHTFNALRNQFHDREFSLLIGADNWVIFDQWKDYQEILRSYPVWIYPRHGFPVTVPASLPAVKMLDAPVIDISSTFIRQSVSEGKEMRRWVPETVWKFIVEKQLYK